MIGRVKGGASEADWNPPVDGSQQGDEDVRGMLMCDWRVPPTPSGALLLPQCPPLAAVVVTHAGLSGKVHHVVLLTRAAGAQRQEKGEGKEDECEYE